MPRWTLATPVVKQTFVTAGVSMNLAGAALVMAYTAGILPQLRKPGSDILIDEATESWIAATPGLSLLLGNFMTPPLMSRFGRKISNMLSISTVVIGWLFIILAKSSTFIIIGRFIQGLGIGSTLNLGPILIAEYTSPRNRGAFLMTQSLLSAVYVLICHVLGSVLHWHINSIICMILTIANLPIVIFSPESPIWLADKERYEECKKVFRWLRGDDEEEELQAIIKASLITHKRDTDDQGPKSFVRSFRCKLSDFKVTIGKKEFYKPVIIMIHLYTLAQWGGINVISAYAIDVFNTIIGEDSNNALHIGVMDSQRIVSNLLAVYIIKKMNRRTMLFSLTILNIFALLSLSTYVYLKSRNIFESSVVGIVLVNVHMFAVASGTLPLPYIIAGEIFPLKYKGLGGGISIVSLAVNFIINVKTLPYLFKTIGLYGAYCLYAGVLGYCLVIAFILLPETKDRTLNDIEEEFKGADEPLNIHELKSVQSLID